MHTQHDFELDKKHAEFLNHAVDITSAILKAFTVGPMGLTPDDVKSSDTYKAAKKRYDNAFAALRVFNTLYVKKYKKELAAERNKRRKQRAS